MSEKSKRVVFTFDARAFQALERITTTGRYPSMAGAVRESLQVMDAIQEHALKGFSEVILRNPATGKEKTVIIPSLKGAKG